MKSVDIVFREIATRNSGLVCDYKYKKALFTGGPAEFENAGEEYNVFGKVGVFAIFVDNAVPVEKNGFCFSGLHSHGTDSFMYFPLLFVKYAMD